MFFGSDGVESRVLRRFQLVGLRNGLWRSLSVVERALYRASIAYTCLRGRIVNGRLLGLLNGLIERLKVNKGSTILRLGRLRAQELGDAFCSKNVFAWCPAMRLWLGETRYRFFLGVTWRIQALCSKVACMRLLPPMRSCRPVDE